MEKSGAENREGEREWVSTIEYGASSLMGQVCENV